MINGHNIWYNPAVMMTMRRYLWELDWRSSESAESWVYCNRITELKEFSFRSSDFAVYWLAILLLIRYDILMFLGLLVRRVYWGFPWFLSVLPERCWDSALSMPRLDLNTSQSHFCCNCINFRSRKTAIDSLNESDRHSQNSNEHPSW
jgi:hypothetical protein